MTQHVYLHCSAQKAVRDTKYKQLITVPVLSGRKSVQAKGDKQLKRK